MDTSLMSLFASNMLGNIGNTSNAASLQQPAAGFSPFGNIFGGDGSIEGMASFLTQGIDLPGSPSAGVNSLPSVNALQNNSSMASLILGQLQQGGTANTSVSSTSINTIA